jgi:hypothetical protein
MRWGNQTRAIHRGIISKLLDVRRPFRTYK